MILLPRDLINFDETKAKVVPVSEARSIISNRPVRRTAGIGPDTRISQRGGLDQSFIEFLCNQRNRFMGDVAPLYGYESGARSAITYEIKWEDGNPSIVAMYKLKAIRIPWDGDWVRHTPNDRWEQFTLTGVPFGTELLSVVEREAANIQRFNQDHERVGLPPTYVPEAIWEYPLRWTGESRNGKPIDEQVAGLVMRAYGDDRIDHLIYCLEASIPRVNTDHVEVGEFPELEEFYQKIGQWVGMRMKVMTDLGYAWKKGAPTTDAHLGNIVIRPEGDEFTLGVTDMSNMLYFPVGVPDDLVQYNVKSIKLRMKDHMCYSTPHREYGRTDGLICPYTGRPNPGTQFRDALLKGFDEGFENPGIVNPVPVSDFYDLLDITKERWPECGRRWLVLRD